MRNPKILTFYTDEMCMTKGVSSTSRSPEKPRLFMNFLKENGFSDYLDIQEFDPFVKEDFYLAHTKAYVNRFFSKGDESNSLTWSKEFAKTVRFTNSSLYNAIRASINNPDKIALSPTSGFHHAHPNSGGGFCTFSGQVIASLKLYKEFDYSGAYIDLDGHYGNSIEDARGFDYDVSKAIPLDCNINPSGRGKQYIASLKSSLKRLEKLYKEKKIHYLVFCHGADSHEWDDLGGGVNTKEWFECSELVYEFARKTGIPLSISLFGGYRHDDYNSVLNLHAGDISIALKILCGVNTGFTPVVKKKTNYWLG
jgi:acetoin utilization deacetylase AcuC-like enzyme